MVPKATTKMLRAQIKILTYIDMSLVVMFSLNKHKISSITNDFKPVWTLENKAPLDPKSKKIYSILNWIPENSP